jgi:long-chain acyl-CoA synthetase
MNLSRNLERSAFFFPDRPAVSEGAREMTYAQLNEKANRVATALLRMGIKPGEHVGLCTPNSGDWLAFYFGVLKTGAVAVTFSSLLKKNELDLLVGHARPRVLLAVDEKLDDLKGLRGSEGIETVISPGGDLDLHRLVEKGSPNFEALDRDRTDTAVILYTGGTTGIPKGVMLSHENVNAAIHTVVFNERSTPEDRAIAPPPCSALMGSFQV